MIATDTIILEIKKIMLAMNFFQVNWKYFAHVILTFLHSWFDEDIVNAKRQMAWILESKNRLPKLVILTAIDVFYK